MDLMAEASPINPKSVPVELPNNEIIIADLTSKSLHPDLLWAKNVLLNPFGIWDVYSAYHKSLRSGVLSWAQNWSRIYSWRNSEKSVRKYMRKILFEECRNVSLFHLLQTNAPLDDLVTAFTLTKKKWQLSYMDHHFDDWCIGYENYCTKTQTGTQFDYRWSEIWALIQDPTFNIYELNYFLQNRKDLDSELFRNLLMQTIPQEARSLIEGRNTDFGSGYYRMTILEIIRGYWHPEANQWENPTGHVPFYTPKKQPLYFDIHSRETAKIIRLNYQKLRPGPSYSIQGLDLRLSGMILGIAFRFKAKNPLSRDWGEVVLSDNDWRLIQLHERRYYKI